MIRTKHTYFPIKNLKDVMEGIAGVEVEDGAVKLMQDYLWSESLKKSKELGVEL